MPGDVGTRGAHGRGDPQPLGDAGAGDVGLHDPHALADQLDRLVDRVHVLAGGDRDRGGGGQRGVVVEGVQGQRALQEPHADRLELAGQRGGGCEVLAPQQVDHQRRVGADAVPHGAHVVGHVRRPARTGTS